MRFLFVLLGVLIFSPLVTLAQGGGLDYGELQLTVDLDPAFPAPEETFTATANDYALPIPGSGIRWFVDGVLRPEFYNQRVITLNAPAYGTSTDIKLVIDYPNGTNISAERIVRPAYLDLVIEPQTKVPAFYKGRPLASVGSTINASAFVNGNNLQASSLMYTWKLDGKVLEGGAIRGRNVITFPLAQGQFSNVTIEVRTLEGDPVARKTLDIPRVEPAVSFYEVSTLYGLRQRATIGTTPLIGNSITVRAEPFFLDLATYNKPDHLEWKINGNKTMNSSKNPYEVTLAIPEGSSGGANRIDFHVRNTVQLLQGAQGSFQVSY